MSDFEQLRQLQASPRQPLADLARVEGQLLTEQQQHIETKKQLQALNVSLAQALEAFDRIANMPVVTMALALNEPDAWRQTTMKLRAVASAAWHDTIGVDPVRGDDDKAADCDDELPLFLQEARREKMRRIWQEVNGR